MDSTAFDALTRRAAVSPLSRRSSLLTLGAAALGAGIAAPSVADAGKAGKKAKKKCKHQVGTCKSVVADFCRTEFGEGTFEEGVCLGNVLPCCDPLKTCNAAASTACFIEVLPPIPV